MNQKPLRTFVRLLVLFAILGSSVFMAHAQGVRPPSAANLSRENSLNPQPLSFTPFNEAGLYIITLEHAPLASYRGGIAGLDATSPVETGARRLDVQSPAVQTYRDFLLARQAEFLQKLEDKLARKVEVRFQYYAATNGLAIRLTPAEAARVAELPEAVAIQPDSMRYPDTDVSPVFTGATTIWDGSNTAGVPGTKGEGVIVGVIDTGIVFSNPSFADLGGDGFNHTNPRGPGNYVGVCNPSNAGYDPTFVCNDKLIGAWDFTGTDLADQDPRDINGHGSHTASTSAGNFVNAAVVGHTITINRQISGIAPHANIIAYRACVDDGCAQTALVAAINQTVLDGVDVINYSIGGAGASAPWTDPDTVAFLNARDAGVFVSTSAGNRGPGAATTGNPADAPWLMSNAASTHNRTVTNALINMSGGSNPPADINGVSFTSGAGPYEIVYAGAYGDPLCLNAFPAGTFTNKIVICDRGNNARVDKGANVLAGSAKGFILANDATSGNALVSDDHYLPAVHITYADGVALKAWVAGGPGRMGTIRGSQYEINDAAADYLTDFSSRGPNRAVGDILKPNITNPGADILAAVGVGNPNPPQYALMSGTSMASPHGAGAGALMKALHPTWTPDEIQSALQLTAWQGVTDYDGTVPDVFDMGSGRMDLTKAGKSGLVMNETKANYLAANPAAGGNPSTLNLPSLGEGECWQTCSWTRTFKSTASAPITWTVEASAANGMDLTFSPAVFTIAPGASQAISVTADVRRTPQDTWAFGEIRLISSDYEVPDVHLPVGAFAISSTNPDVLTKTASASLVQVGSNIQYTINLTHTSYSAATYNLSDPIPANTSYVAGSATGGLTFNSGTNTLSWSGSIPGGVFSVSEQSRSGYISLAELGVPPEDVTFQPNADDGITLLTGMDYQYFGTSYTGIVISSNGAILPYNGGIPTIPSGANVSLPNGNAAPNNIIAPFWANLNFTSAGELYIALMEYNLKEYYIIEWENVPVAGGGTATFQLWIEVGAENMWFSYPAGGLPAGAIATIGAENNNGSVGYSYYYKGSTGPVTGALPTGEYDLAFGPLPTVKTFTFNVTANAAPGALNTVTVNDGANTNIATAYTTIYAANTWLGYTQSWETASNWSRNAVPTASDAVVIPTSPVGGQFPVLSGAAAVFSLAVQPGASLDLGTHPFSAEDSVINQGTLKQTRNVDAGPIVSFLHITNATGTQDKYFGVDISSREMALGSTTVAIDGQSQCTTDDPTDSVNRCYDITPTEEETADVRFYFLESERDGMTVANLKAWHWSGAAWEEAGFTSDRGAQGADYHWVEAASVSSFSPFTLSDKVDGPTAVTLSGAIARQAGQLWLPALIAAGLIVALAGAWVLKRRQA